ncbi:hypothetical protein ABEB22_12160 [Thioclava sp. 'Guangxiensis']|uniref:hypothetical protein n=1 Tax=Thioclava sp. 'Guangxiensis' TaxID=3149044 RepID=UPI003877E0CE
MILLTWLGRHARALLFTGFCVIPFLPVSPEALRPVLAPLVISVTALGIMRQPFTRVEIARVFGWMAVLRGVLFLAASQLGLALLFRLTGLWVAWPLAIALPVAAFCAAPPLSSAPNLALMLRYDFPQALRITLLGTLLAPLTMPLSLWLSGLDFTGSISEVALRLLGMLAGGIALGAALQAWLGMERIRQGADALNGIAALFMLAFLIPLIGGMAHLVAQDPARAAIYLALALILNIGGNLALRWVAGQLSGGGRALGLVFGNRNTGLVLAALPFDPHLALFVAAMQAPIYLGPAVFSHFERRPTPGEISEVS